MQLHKIRPMVFAAMAALVAFYPAMAAHANSCDQASARSAAVGAAATGEVAGFLAAKSPQDLSGLAFTGPDGKGVTVGDFKGRTVLLNLWATWCVPCRKEMPALDTLQTDMGGPDFTVVTVNIDTRNPEKPREWLKENKIDNLTYYADPEAKIFQVLRRMSLALGMPTTLLVNADSCALGVLHGQAEWAGHDAKRLIRAAIGK